MALTGGEALTQDLLNHWFSLIHAAREGCAGVCVCELSEKTEGPSEKDKNNDVKEEVELFSVLLSMRVREACKRSKVLS